MVEGAVDLDTIARTQAYALRQLDALAEKLESKRTTEVRDKAFVTGATESTPPDAPVARR